MENARSTIDYNALVKDDPARHPQAFNPTNSMGVQAIANKPVDAEVFCAKRSKVLLWVRFSGVNRNLVSCQRFFSENKLVGI